MQFSPLVDRWQSSSVSRATRAHASLMNNQNHDTRGDCTITVVVKEAFPRRTSVNIRLTARVLDRRFILDDSLLDDAADAVPRPQIITQKCMTPSRLAAYS